MTLRKSLVNDENFMKNKANSFGLFKRKIPFLKNNFIHFPSLKSVKTKMTDHSLRMKQTT